jgi:hypothetical protein
MKSVDSNSVLWGDQSGRESLNPALLYRSCTVLEIPVVISLVCPPRIVNSLPCLIPCAVLLLLSEPLCGYSLHSV